MFGKRKNKRDLATAQIFRHIDKRTLKYVVEREEGTNGELIIGREGAINVHDDEISINCGAKEVARLKRKGAVIGELISLNGVQIRADDVYSGKRRNIVAYYQYYRK